MSKVCVEVLLDQNLKRPLDYLIPEHLQGKLEVGMRVEVPLKSTLKQGTISKIKPVSSAFPLKPIERILVSQGELSPSLWKLAEWIADYYAAPLQRVLKCFIPAGVRKEIKQKKQIFVKILQTHEQTLSAIAQLRAKFPLQAAALEQIVNVPKGILFSDLNVSRSVVESLAKKKLVSLQSIDSDSDLLLEEEFFPTLAKTLNEEQKKCLDEIEASLCRHAFAAHLIFGVTGSGKTEIYMQAIQKTLDLGKSAIMLVPEVSLTSQTIERFRSRFPQKIAILHHKRSSGERTAAWESLRKGETKLVIGARSALFCPAQNVGLIIVDEEHDSSYKQSDESPCYHGRDAAVMRAHLENCTVLLGSATPSIESRYNAEIGKYRLHTLTTRAAQADLPEVKMVDMKRAFERSKGFTHFSDELLDGIKKRISLGEQTLLLLNRRGYHRMQTCGHCRHIMKCPHCDISLTFHREDNLLQCHLCDAKTCPPRECPNCKKQEQLQFKGFGTEHVERTLHALLPGIRTLRMDKDTTQKKNSHEELFKQFRAHKADVLIGTQMVAKGFHFPSVTLVGVLNPDAALTIPDFRSPEQVFQLLTQVAGRAGRAELKGEVMIQTFLPDHPTLLLASAQDYPSFYKAEIEERRLFSYPPFCRLVKLLFSGPDESAALKMAQDAHALALNNLPPETQVLPVVAAGHAKVKDLYRFQFIIKTLKISHLKNFLPLFSKEAKIDVDPLSTYF